MQCAFTRIARASTRCAHVHCSLLRAAVVNLTFSPSSRASAQGSQPYSWLACARKYAARCKRVASDRLFSRCARPPRADQVHSMSDMVGVHGRSMCHVFWPLQLLTLFSFDSLYTGAFSIALHMYIARRAYTCRSARLWPDFGGNFIVLKASRLQQFGR